MVRDARERRAPHHEDLLSAFAAATCREFVPQRPRPLTDMANEPSKKSFVYSTLSFRVYDWNCPRLDTEWLLSTLFDASLLSTFKAAGFPAALFLVQSVFERSGYRLASRKRVKTRASFR
ncbi:hypothetical protein GWG65_11275 [Bradyrhizobium sp. CSA207]|nr:hypothetical protein [Bradyrhizobium sp. CSA207]